MKSLNPDIEVDVTLKLVSKTNIVGRAITNLNELQLQQCIKKKKVWESTTSLRTLVHYNVKKVKKENHPKYFSVFNQVLYSNIGDCKHLDCLRSNTYTLKT